MSDSISITGPADAPGLRTYRGLSVRTASGLYDVALPARMPAAEAATVAALLSAAPDMLAALTGLYDLCLSASSPDAFRNGVTDSSGTIDEGDARASRLLDIARAAIASAKAGR